MKLAVWLQQPHWNISNLTLNITR